MSILNMRIDVYIYTGRYHNFELHRGKRTLNSFLKDSLYKETTSTDTASNALALH